MATRNKITVFTDGSYCDKTNACGWAALIIHGSPRQRIAISGNGMINGSTQAEVMAIESAIVHLLENIPVAGKVIEIRVDCISALNLINTTALTSAGAIDIVKRPVRGHRGIRTPESAANTWCDIHAKEQMRELRNKILADINKSEAIHEELL